MASASRRSLRTASGPPHIPHSAINSHRLGSQTPSAALQTQHKRPYNYVVTKCVATGALGLRPGHVLSPGYAARHPWAKKPSRKSCCDSYSVTLPPGGDGRAADTCGPCGASARVAAVPLSRMHAQRVIEWAGLPPASHLSNTRARAKPYITSETNESQRAPPSAAACSATLLPCQHIHTQRPQHP